MLTKSETPLLCSLATSEQFVLTAARLWVTPYRDAASSGVEWRDGFSAAGLDDMASMSFDVTMRSIAAARRVNLDIRWPCCLRLGVDEICLLDCLSLIQAKRTNAAVARLTAWLSPAAARIAYLPATRLAESFRNADIVLPARPAHHGPQRDAFENYRHLDPGALLVH